MAHHVLTKFEIISKEASTEAASLARELGLEVMARRYEKALAENVFTPLTEDEVLIWAYHCPTRYIPGTENNGNWKKLEVYAFDSIPVEVMKHWKSIKDNYAFDHFEVWTTERVQQRNLTDPLLIGVIGQKFYLLARWGLESPENVSVRDLAKKIHDEAYERAIEAFSHCFWRKKEERIIDWIVNHMRDHEAFRACRRMLGLSVPAPTFSYYDW